MEQAFSRTELLLGSSALERLAASRVAVFGIGGVGGYVCEALARTGVGHLDLIDSDTVAVSNINRQIIATTKTVGQYKTDAMEARILDINPAAKITKHNCFFLPETAADFPFNQYDYVVDAVDTMSAKLALVTHCHAAGVPIICAMGAGQGDPDHPGRRSTPGSVAFVPSVMGLILAGEVIKDLMKAEK